ncbi:MAG TPA: hypothetical protein VMF08_14745, partial [Candidatus Sulfotelmatobacter sp.]|nr:hypothetical protein [Candidatus Sulfotelmatobacter sp.]
IDYTASETNAGTVNQPDLYPAISRDVLITTTPTEESILKTDVIGRVRTPSSLREQLLDEFEKSGLSGQEFAKLVGVKYLTFATWAQRRRRARGTMRHSTITIM